jgi:hypothetical protein
MTGRLTAIETMYRDVRFRSRQEARWAVLFDELNIAWRYEIEGYKLPTHWYLPDFWLPELRCFAEVKGIIEQWDGEALRKAHELALVSHCSVLLCDEISDWPLIPGLHPHAGIVDQYNVDLIRSALNCRLWIEVDGYPETSYMRWSDAAYTAQKTRFLCGPF